MQTLDVTQTWSIGNIQPQSDLHVGSVCYLGFNLSISWWLSSVWSILEGVSCFVKNKNGFFDWPKKFWFTVVNYVRMPSTIMNLIFFNGAKKEFGFEEDKGDFLNVKCLGRKKFRWKLQRSIHFVGTTNDLCSSCSGNKSQWNIP